MIHVKVEKIGNAVAIVLDDQAQALLGVAPGDTLQLAQTEEGVVVRDADAVARGRLFVERYIKTFEALAR